MSHQVDNVYKSYYVNIAYVYSTQEGVCHHQQRQMEAVTPEGCLLQERAHKEAPLSSSNVMIRHFKWSELYFRINIRSYLYF
jgi:hypothetical protein